MWKFTGFIFCGHCHRALSRNTASFRCSVDRKVNPERAKAISLKDLEERVWNEILAKATAAKEILEREEKAVEEDPLDARIKILRDEMFNRFTEYSDGKITKDEFARFQNRAKAMVTDMEKRRDAEIERKEYLERRREVLRPLVRTLELPELTRDALTAVVNKIYWYDGVLEVLVKGEEYLGGVEPESLVNID